MTTPPIIITSQTELDDIDHHFKVAAGPGAGKTHWLVRHIHTVVQRSSRLTGNRQICCISYTNVAVNEIRRRLGAAARRVEVATIHSFLYRYIVKPYLPYLHDEAGRPLVNYTLVQGHDQHQPHYPKVEQWLKAVGKSQLLRDETKRRELWDLLGKLQWKLEGSMWQLAALQQRGLRFEQGHYQAYKQLYWDEGILDHSDVLYLTHQLVKRFPHLVRFLSARFPYVFVDEFQDTNPTQTQLIKQLAAAGSTIGVIGDGEQSIYKFLDARPEDFHAFHLDLENCRCYTIADNHRSTNQIIALLNHVRSDGLKQQGLRNMDGPSVTVLIGPHHAAVAYVRRHHAEDVLILGHKHKSLRALQGLSQKEASPWDAFAEVDRQRHLFFSRLMEAIALRDNGHPGQAMDLLSRTIYSTSKRTLRDPFRPKDHQPSRQEIKTIAIHLLRTASIVAQQDSSVSLRFVYEQLDSTLQICCSPIRLTGMTRGKFADFAETCSWETLKKTLSSPESRQSFRTVHRAKGEEFAHVLVHVDKEEQFYRSLSGDPSQKREEDHRVFYVALSRARERLWIHLEQMSQPQLPILDVLNIECINVGGSRADAITSKQVTGKRQRKANKPTPPTQDDNTKSPSVHQGTLFEL